MKHLIVGLGQIGIPIRNILSDVFDVEACDDARRVKPLSKEFDAVHICFAHKEDEAEDFISWVEDYKRRFLKEDGITIIHSTVSIGISRKLDAVHSPIRGMHPHLEEGIRKFTKFFSGKNASRAAEYFRRAGLKVHTFNDQEVTELGKLSETTFYALMIEYIKELKRDCDEAGLSFSEVYTLQAMGYNEGWKALNHSEYSMPLLTPIMEKQGGHCTRHNCDLWDTPFTKIIKDLNDNARYS